jgi:hypothetical protein
VAVNNVAAMSADNPWLTIPLADYEAHMALPEITPSPFTSLGRLAPRLRLVSPERLVRLAARRGLRASDTRTVTATGGKRFAVQSFVRG